MIWMVWTGALVTILGVIALTGCMYSAMRARNSDLPDDQMRKVLQRLVAWNMGALALSAVGLMMVVVGLMLS